MDITKKAKEQKQLVLFPGGDHGISQYKDEMFDMIRNWIIKQL